MNVSGIQSAIFVSNAVGMIPGLETTTSDAALTFFFSIATMTTLILIGFALHNVLLFNFIPYRNSVDNDPFYYYD